MNVEDAARCGRPKTVTPTIMKKVASYLKKKGGSIRKTKRKLEVIDTLSYSIGTIYNIAKQLKLVPKKLRVKPLIKSKQKEKRLEYCIQERITKLYWRKALFTDEKLFFLNFIPNHQWVFVDNPPPIHRTVKYPGKLMIWGGVSFYGRLPLVFAGQKEGINSDAYIEVLQKALIDNENNIFQSIHKWKLLQDRAPCHMSHKVRNWLADHNIDWELDFPASSPYLNVIENVWKLITDKVNTRCPRTVQGLCKVIQQEWDTLDQKVICDLVMSMPRRLQAVLDVEGEITKY